VLQRQRKGSVSSDASASTDSNTYYEDDFSSTEEDSSQGNEHFFLFKGHWQSTATWAQRYHATPEIEACHKELTKVMIMHEPF